MVILQRMWTLDHLGQFIDAVSWEASSTQEELVELKTDLAKAVVEKMKEIVPEYVSNNSKYTILDKQTVSNK